ncbi:MAG: MFS transporter, partial [Chloroflexi bacterium]
MSENRNPWPVLLVTVLGFFMIMLDTTIVYVATPSILSNLHASLDQILWVFNGYLLTYAVLLITAGRIGDIFGPRQLFAAGLVVFTAASAACGLSQDANQLIAARVIQGVGGALIAPQTLSILMSIFPSERRGAAFGVVGAVIGISTVAGPTLGGLIVTNWDWRWIFYLNLPIGILALAGTFLVIPDLRPGRRHRVDVVGVLLSSAALFAVVFGLIEG